ncbi:MAG: TRAP transporter large permease subunit, partial [Firmicutes bacterium]|nr:TRAP transporter large permease subunit [Bacillota bacterium]
MAVLFGTLVLFMVLGAPIVFAVGTSVIFWLVFVGEIPLIMVAQRMFAGINNWTFLAVPLFMLAGNLMNEAGITDKLIRFVNSYLGHIKGGLSLVNIAASMVFAGISGTAVGDASSLGAILIPAMTKEGYEADFSCAVTASSSVIGPVIPPSLSMVV